ncbi:uncharacterized protein LOC107829311 [Nicotiana tabacum]|uniref:Uncharacterized protein LOC107829311 n=1 Tax=Nicotiana tabacum TaxID=4097 RepID=A0AC58S3W9_TOBAC
MDIAQAKTLLMQDPNFKIGFKFDHVWDMMKYFEKFSDVDFGRTKVRKHGSTYVSSESEARTPSSPLVSFPNLSSFSLKLNEDVAASRQKEYKEENKILLTNLNSIDDPNLREFLRQ